MSKQVHFLVVTDPDTTEKNITVFVSGAEKPYTAHSSHPNFDAILQGALDGDESVVELFDVGETVAKRFESLSERVTVSGGHVFFDGDEVDSSLTRQIVRFLNEGVDDWQPLVNFFERVQQNPNDHSREQLFSWLNDRDFTITRDGNFIAYKGVGKDDDGTLRSLNSGAGIVNGEAQTGRLDNSVGNVVEMPRSAVNHDPTHGCSTGLHVGTYGYAQSYARGAMLKVEVNPRDVVSVPTDCSAQKMRTCRYRVLEIVQSEVNTALDEDEYDEFGDAFDEDEDYCALCDGPCTA